MLYRSSLKRFGKSLLSNKPKCVSPSSMIRMSSAPTPSVKPSVLADSEIRLMFEEMHEELSLPNCKELGEMAKYYFDGKGKAIRPIIAITLGKAINYHLSREHDDILVNRQRRVAIISEMIHTASLVHDDVLDHAETRRGKKSVNVRWGIQKSTICGDYILSVASVMMSKLGNDDAVIVLSKILSDLVHGEFQQLQNKKTESERFQLYLNKTFNKTASLIAYSCQANAMLADAPSELIEASYEYGRNVGIAFQLVDDLLDFVSSSKLLGKPAAADLHLGLATAPVLFATSKFRQLESMIDRRFSEPGDVEAAFDAVLKSDGLEKTKELAKSHCEESIKAIQRLSDSPYKRSLIEITDAVLNRMK